MKVHPRIAIVDDDDALRSALGRLVRSFGYEAAQFSRAADLTHEEARNIDCLVTDIQMPEMSGFELLRRLQAERPRLPIIVMTAYPALHREQEALGLGAVRFFAKPISASALEAALRDILAGGGE